MDYHLTYIPEPLLQFGCNQSLEDPHDGLSLFGPLDHAQTYGIRIGVVGTQNGIALFRGWLVSIRSSISISSPHLARPPFPGFEAIFQTRLEGKPALELVIPDEKLTTIYLDDIYQRVYKTVDVYSSLILGAVSGEDTEVDIWFVIVPNELYRYCRPKSVVVLDNRVKVDSKMKLSTARSFRSTPSLFEQDNIAAKPYHYQPDFRNQLKARLLSNLRPIQIVKESTLQPYDPDTRTTWRKPVDFSSEIAWYLSTAMFYKAGGRPWKLSEIRDGVCYLGIVFKQEERSGKTGSACCAAQMFLDSGDGFVFKGAVGPWHNPNTGQFHLHRDAARELVSMAKTAYQDKMGKPPKEIFLHGRVNFDDEEWRGFSEAAGDSTVLVGVRIQPSSNLKLFTDSTLPILRGSIFIQNTTTAYLWTNGLIPKIGTYPGRETPNPLFINICRGEAGIETVARDIMALTKLNYNACRISDSLPITLKFADAVGEILTAGPITAKAPLPFKFYM
ncbi:hypothetical protein LLG46_08565 [bacterium]|nr:hypothetical protein [bacterium]